MTIRNRSVLVARIVISAGLLACLFLLVDWRQAYTAFASADLSLVAFGTLFWFGSVGVGALRWRTILADHRADLSFRRAYGAYLVGSFYNVFLPGAVGGDVVRAGIAVKATGCSVSTSVAGVLLERVAGVIAAVSLLLGTFVVTPTLWTDLLTTGSARSLQLTAVLLLLALVVGIPLARSAARRFPENATGRVRRTVVAALQPAARLQWITLASVILLSLAFQGLRFTGMWVLAKALGLPLGLPVFFAIMPLVYLATLVPISLGGLGVREGSMVLLLDGLGVPASQAVVLAFLIYFNQVLLGLAGGLLQLRGWKGARGDEKPSDRAGP